MTSFDASIDLTVHTVPASIPPDAAVQRVRTAVEALDGAAWVSVAWCGDCPPGLPWLRVWAAGDSTPRAGVRWMRWPQ
jgi:hypothetical protein